jgi:UDP-GlcNAc:undecaprenyl-phosphate GlcNAc-1-phosphate transferase
VISYLAVFAAAAVVTGVTTPLVRRFVERAGAIYRPNDRSVHRVPLPTMGGIAMYLGLIAALIASQLLPFFDEINRTSPPRATLIACTLMLGLGVIDDTRGITALTKFVAQVFIAGVLVLFGVQFHYFWLPGLHTFVLSGDLGAIATIVWVLAVANAVNLVDGLDGLAAGMVAIAASAFFIYVVRSGGLFGLASDAAMLAAITCGVCLGFLPWNFHPAKIFMGDTGSMLLGMLLAITTIRGVGKNFTQPTAGDIVQVAGAIAVPILVLLVPFLDVVLAIIRRTRRGVGIGHADKDHLHHHLMDIGHGHRQAVLLMYLWSALVSGGALAVGLIDGRFVVGLILLGAAALFLVTALPRLATRRTTNGSHRVAARTSKGPDAQAGNVSEHAEASDPPENPPFRRSV